MDDNMTIEEVDNETPRIPSQARNSHSQVFVLQSQDRRNEEEEELIDEEESEEEESRVVPIDEEEESEEETSDEEEDTEDSDNPVVPLHPAIKYQRSRKKERELLDVAADDVPGYNMGFSPQLCSDLRIKVDIDSSIVIRETFSSILSVFEQPESNENDPTATIRVNTDIKPNSGSFGIHIQLDDTPVGKMVNKDLRVSLCYEIAEISCNDILHKLHMVIIDEELWARKQRNIPFEKRGGYIVSKTLSEAKSKLITGRNTSLTMREKIALQALNQPGSNRKGKAVQSGIRSQDIRNQSTPKWNLMVYEMQKIAEKFDEIVSNFGTDNITNRDDVIKASMKRCSFFIATQAGSKGILTYKNLISIPERTCRRATTLQEDALKQFELDSEEKGLQEARDIRNTSFERIGTMIDSSLREAIVGDVALRKWVKSASKRRLFPGLEEGPILLDIGYQFMFEKNDSLIILCEPEWAAPCIKEMIIETQRYGDIDSDPSNRTTEESTSTEEEFDLITEEILEDMRMVSIEEDSLEDSESPLVPNAEADNTRIDASMDEEMNRLGEESETEEESGDHELNTTSGTFHEESHKQVIELVAEARNFIGEDNRIYHDAISLLLSPTDDNGKSSKERGSLHRESVSSGRYMFGTQYGNMYTGYPRVVHSGHRANGTGNDNHYCYKNMEYPHPGPVSAVVYASGLKNTNIALHDNINPDALNGYGAMTHLVLEESELLEGERSHCIEKWIQMTNIIRRQVDNEEHYMKEAKKRNNPFTHSLRMEYRTCIRFGPKPETEPEPVQETDAGDDGDSIPDRDEDTSFVPPWPKGVLPYLEVEHTARYHQYRHSNLNRLFVPISNMATVLSQAGGHQSCHSLSRLQKNFLVAAAAITENFVSIFASHASRRFALFKDEERLREFYLPANQVVIPAGEANLMEVPYGIEDRVVQGFKRSREMQDLIDPKSFLPLRSGVNNFRMNRNSTACRHRAKAQRLTPNEAYHAEVLKRYYFKRRKPIDPKGLILTRQKMKFFLQELVEHVPDHTSLEEEPVLDDDGEEVPTPQRTVPAFLQMSLEEVKVFVVEKVMSLLREVYFREYDAMLRRNKCFDTVFKNMDDTTNRTTEEVFVECRSDIKKLAAQITQSSGTEGGTDGVYVVQPFNGLNQMRRKANINASKRDQPFTRIGTFQMIPIRFRVQIQTEYDS